MRYAGERPYIAGRDDAPPLALAVVLALAIGLGVFVLYAVSGGW